MKMDTTTPEKLGRLRMSFPPKNHEGYCPVTADAKVLGRYMYYDVAKEKGGAMVMRYADAVKRGLVKDRTGVAA